MMDSKLKKYFYNSLLALADSDLIHSQSLATLCSKGPELEIDIALSNIALDFLGQARMLYQIATKYAEEPTDEDKIAYFRNEREFRNNMIVEQPNQDFAYTIVKQCMLDQFRQLFLSELVKIDHVDLAGIAGKAVKENAYHIKFSHHWLLRLGDGTEESHYRAQAALNTLWPYRKDLFVYTEEEVALTDKMGYPPIAMLEAMWLEKITASIHEATLNIPNDYPHYTGGKDGLHTEQLGFILTEMQILQRSHPGLEW